jgi:hypothetical protein
MAIDENRLGSFGMLMLKVAGGTYWFGFDGTILMPFFKK